MGTEMKDLDIIISHSNSKQDKICGASEICVGTAA